MHIGELHVRVFRVRKGREKEGAWEGGKPSLRASERLGSVIPSSRGTAAAAARSFCNSRVNRDDTEECTCSGRLFRGRGWHTPLHMPLNVKAKSNLLTRYEHMNSKNCLICVLCALIRGNLSFVGIFGLRLTYLSTQL